MSASKRTIAGLLTAAVPTGDSRGAQTAPRLGALLALIAAVAVVSSGCAAKPDTSPYAAQLAAARQQTTVPEILAALSDDVITDAEYQQAVNLTITCMADRGVTATYAGNGELSAEVPTTMTSDQVNRIETDCGGPRMDPLAPLYFGPKVNPNNAASDELLLACFKRFNLVPQSMTVDQFDAVDFDNPPWPKLSGDAFGCMVNPVSYNGGHPDVKEGEEFH